MLTKKGKVYIVGAGPGDPELLTIKGLRLIKEADVVVYDRLVPNEILDLIPSNIERIYAGKSCRKHVMTQEEINHVLVVEGKLGKNVVRLKGGDPLIFGRVGEEIEFLAKNQIDFEIIPGVTSASGCASIANIPLTHRGIANSVKFITGHQQKGEEIDLNWHDLANPMTTIVIYMGLANLEKISVNLINAGLAKTTPTAAIHEGTTSRQRILFSTLSRIFNDLQKAEFLSPTLVIMGKTVALGKKHLSR